MNVGRYVVRFLWAYVLSLVLMGTFTIVWLFFPALRSASIVAGLWFAVAGFGTLIIVIIVLVELSRY